MSINALGSNSFLQDVYSSPLTKRAEKEKTPAGKDVKGAIETNNISAKNEENLSTKAQ